MIPDTYKAVKALEKAGASTELAEAMVNIGYPANGVATKNDIKDIKHRMATKDDIKNLIERFEEFFKLHLKLISICITISIAALGGIIAVLVLMVQLVAKL